ncbi:biliverdin-producing heme oxygenase [Frigoribacterium sp. PvP032]|uniref:biliverdin-producing heme oxygenase n=1 Tax=Frigoribacterium sp. PvP032 TaxID=2806589 RepID=UPI001B4BD7C7|nr:biliverdin-producing heme oxygenase [Frigoribacterium sp. PvP032]MBP1189702.1 heme oxygenase [Frigoribacterium sp. PvP032]
MTITTTAAAPPTEADLAVPPAPVPFSELLRTRTRSGHGTSSRASFMSDLMRGTCSRDDLVRLLAQYWHVYGALEQAAVIAAAHPVAGAFVTDRLTRLPSLEADLGHLVGPAWRDHLAAVPATVEYVDRLQKAAGSSSPTAFVAHHYTRYLGDLSGGQHIGRALRLRYGLPDEATSFFTFDAIADPTAFKDEYRARLDSLPWGEADQEAVVTEVLHAYDLNARLLAELDAERGLGPSPDPGAAVRPVAVAGAAS